MLLVLVILLCSIKQAVALRLITTEVNTTLLRATI